MDQVTSGLEADRKYARKELRADKEFAREVFEFLLPDEKIRRKCLEFMANSIHAANRLAPERWGITLQDDFVRLNCGMIEIITIAPDQFHLIIDVDSLPELPPDQAEIRKTYNGSTKGFYPSVRGSVACDFEAEKAFHVFPQIEDSHRRLIQKAARSPFGPNRKNAHSPSVIQYLNEYLNLSLSQPAYFEPATQVEADSVPLPLLEPAEQLPDIDKEVVALEGGQKFVMHLRRERDPKIIRAKKQEVLRKTGRLQCEACAFDFKERYGELGSEFCEVHHLVLLSESDQMVETKLSDLAILCSNCHRMIHKTKPMESVTEFKQRLLP